MGFRTFLCSLTKGAELGGELGTIQGTLLVWAAQGVLTSDRYPASDCSPLTAVE